VFRQAGFVPRPPSGLVRRGLWRRDGRRLRGRRRQPDARRESV